MKLPKITTKQQDILKLLYRYRFLNRIQIQKLMGHKNKMRTIVWLKDLRDKGYIEWIYSTDFAEKTKPAIYYLGLNGVRYLRSTHDYPLDEVRKRYRESARNQLFIDRSLLIADCCITLRDQCSDTVTYTTVTQADFVSPKNPYHFLGDSDLIKPQLCYIKQSDSPEGPTTKSYLLEVFDTTLPIYSLRKRLKSYQRYLAYGDWQHYKKGEQPLTILLVLPTLPAMIYAKRRTRMLVKQFTGKKNTHIKFTTAEELKQHGVTAAIWEA